MSDPGDAIHVLHVDDDPEFTDLVAMYLEREDDRITVRTAENTGEGLDVLADHDVDCIVSDYDMPGRNGIEFLDVVRADSSDLPFILYTGKGSEEVASDAISAGVTDYLQKERGTDQYTVLANRVSNAVESYRSRRALDRRNRDLRRYKHMINSMQEAACIYDEDGRFVVVNEYLASWYDSDRDALEGQHSNLVPSIRAQAEDEDPYQALLDGRREQITGEITADFPDHGHAVVEYQLTPLTVDGDVEGIVGVARDVTERKARETELHRIERRYQAIFDDPNILVGLIDTDGTVLDINQTAMDYVDATDEEIRDRPFWETPWFDHSESIQQAVREWIDRAAAGEYVEFETDLVSSAGEQYTIEGVFRPVTDDDGEVVSLLISDSDITERKRRERELKRYEAYLEESTDIITVLDEDGAIKYQSPAVEDMLGYDRDELLGQNGFDYIHPDDVERITELFADLVADPGGTVTTECRFRTADGGSHWLEVRGTNQLDNDPINGVVTNNRIITERKERELELERTNALLSTLFQTLPVGVLAEDGSRNVLAVNDRFFELFDLPGTPDEVIGEDCRGLARSVSEMFANSHRFVDRIEEIVDRQESVYSEELSLRDGRTFTRSHEPIELPDGEGHLWVYRDISAFKEREKTLQRERDRLDQFASVVSHDLRNPLNVVEGRLDYVRKECDSEHFDPIENAVDRMGRIIEDVLWLAREGQDIGAVEPVDLQHVIDAAWDLVADDADGATLQYPAEALSTVTIEADYDRFNQLLENLFANAIEHGGEPVTVTVGLVDDGFYVADSGPGIPEDVRDDVFTAGYSKSREGTGFGLTIVEQVADAHGWEISIGESSDGGARFEITGVDFVEQ